MSFVYKIDDELSLRLIEPQHADEIFAIVDVNREHIGRWLPWISPESTIEDTRAFAGRSLIDFAERRQLAVSLLVDGRVAGGSGWTDWRQVSLFHDQLQISQADIGYWIGEAYQGRGLVTRAVRGLTALAFETYGIHRLTIRAEPDNKRSCSVAERLGYKLEGMMRGVGVHAGRTYDHRLYAMLAEEWAPTSSRRRPRRTCQQSTGSRWLKQSKQVKSKKKPGPASLREREDHRGF